MDEEAIRKTVRDRLKKGHLPRHLPTATPSKPGQPVSDTIVVGSMLAEPCAACDRGGTQIKYKYPSGPIAFHSRCNEIWEEERGKPSPRS
jgi:hypothetical protein